MSRRFPARSSVLALRPHSRGWRACALAALLAHGGCTLEPSYQRPALPIDDAYPQGPGYRSSVKPQINQSIERSGNKEAGGAPATAAQVAAADLGWRDFLRDAQLQRLVELALQNNRDLRVAILNVEAARAQYGIERSGLFPSVAANAVGARGRGDITLFTTGGPVYNVVAAYASVNWELDVFGRVRSLEHAALEQYLASAQARKSAQILLVAEVATQYLTLVAADEALAVTVDSQQIAEESYRLAQLQYSAGTGSELDLREAQGVLEQARAQLAVEQRARAQARNALVLLVGAPLPTDLPLGQTLGDQAFLTDIPPGLPSDLLKRRPDIAQAEDLLIAANANIGAARAAFFPDISLTAAAGAASPALGQLFRAGNRAWDVGPGVVLPIFNGGLNTANLKQAKTQRAIAVAQYEKTVQTAFREVADALSARATYEDQVDALQRQVKAQQRRLALAQLRYKTGVDSYLTLLIAQNDLNNAQLARVSASLGRLINLVALYQDLGGGWLEHQGETPKAVDSPP
jgi:multidrug efflux system outer membrane protein